MASLANLAVDLEAALELGGVVKPERPPKRPFLLWWFRLLFILLAMPGGLPGFLPYIILALIIPPRDR